MKEWIWKYLNTKWSLIVFCVMALFCGIIVYRVFSFIHESDQDNLRLVAETKFFEWKKNPLNLELFNDLHHVLEKDSKLLRKYDGQVAQILIESQQPQEFLSFAKMATERLKEVPYYSLYSTSTCEINQENFEKALNHSLHLKKELETSLADQKDLSMGEVLYAFNLIRIAFLHKKLNHKEKETVSWKNIQSFFGWTEALSLPYRVSEKTRKVILDNYRENNMDLKAYIHSRLHKLES